MNKWFFGRTNAYAFVAKIDGETARVLTETEDFPDSDDLDAVKAFMADVIDWDYSDTWEEYPAQEMLEEIENKDEIIFETEA